MSNQVEYGIRISINGNKEAADGFDAMTQASTKFGEATKQSADKTVTAQNSIAASAEKTAEAQRKVGESFTKSNSESKKSNEESVTAAAKAAAAQAKLELQQQRLIESLTRKTEAIGKTNSQLASMRAAELGVSDVAAPLIAKLAATEKGISNVGMSAAATSAAMRNVPAQFTDIVVSLQAGQSPMTVMLQQGGQLKDMFGGTGNAAKALGSYVLGLVNPFTVGAAAVGVITYAYIGGSQEAKEFEKNIIMSGNAAGATVDKLLDLSTKINDLGLGSKSAANEAINQMINTGGVSSAILEKASMAAIQSQKLLGKEVADTAKEFAELGKNPTAAVEKLNDKYHFLTLSVYEQIKALEDQGRSIEAANLAQSTYADALDAMNKKVNVSLTDWERGYNRIKQAAAGAVDAIFDIGRQDSKQEEIAKLFKERDKLEQAQKKLAGDTSFINRGNAERVDRDLELNKQKINAIREQIKATNDLSAAKEKEIQQEKAGEQWIKEKEKYLSKAAQMEKEITKARNLGKAAGIDQAEIDEQVNAIREKNADKKVKGVAKEIVAYKSLILTMQEQLATSAAELTQTENLTEGQKLRVKFDTLLREGKIKATAAEQEYAKSLANQIDINNRKEIADNKAKKLTDEQTEASVKLKSAVDDYVNSLAGSNEQAQLEVTLLGKTEAERKIAIEQFKVELALRKQIKAIENSKATKADQVVQIQRATEAALERKEKIVVEVNTDEIEKARKELDAFLDPAKAQSFSDALVGALGNAGNAMQKLSANLQDYTRTEAELIKARANAEKTRDTDPIRYARDIAAINEKTARAQINNYANIAGAAKNFFQEGTRGYKALEAAENAFRVVQLASDLAKGMSAAVVGIANQAQGDPYTALPRMAAMAAAMAALGFATGFLGSSGGGGKSAADAQKEQGTGSVFGDMSAKSESIKNSIEEMSKSSNRLLPVNQGMLIALKNIESSMAGFTNLVVRDQGVVNGSNLNIRTGTIDRSGMSMTTAVLLTGVMAPITKWLASLWGKTTQNVVDSGVSFGGKLTDLQSGRGFAQYASVDTTTSSWFGLKKSTSNSVQSQALSAELSSQLGLIFSGMSAALKEANKSLGGNVDEIEKTLTNLTLSTSNVSLKGLSGQALTDALNGVISKSLDEMAQAAFPAYDQFRSVGEGYAQTVLRVANTFASVNQIIGEIGLKLFETGVAGVEASLGFEKLMGGLENLQSVTSSYLQNFYTEKERTDKIRGELTNALSGVGVAMPTDRDGYRQAVEKASNEGKLETVAVLLKLSDAFASIVPAAENLIDTTSTAKANAEALLQRNEAIQNQIDNLEKASMSLQARRELEHKGMEKSTLDLQLKYERLQDEATASDKARAAAEKLQATNDGIQSQIETLERASMSLEARRELEHKGMEKSTLDLQLKYERLQDEAAASDKARAAAEKLQATNDGIQAQIDELEKASMSLAARRELEHKGMEKSTLDLQLKYERLQDEAAASDKARVAAEKLQATNDGIQAQIENLERASMSLEARRELEHKGMEKSTLDLQLKYERLQDEAAASDKARAAAEKLQATNDGIQAQIENLERASMSLEARRALEHKGMEKSTLDLQLKYEALLDEAAASEKARAAIDKLKTTNESIQKQIDDLVYASLSLADQRALEVVGVDDTTLALKEKLWALQDNERAAKQVAAAEAEARQAYNSWISDVKSAFQREASVFESTIDKFTNLAKGLEQYAKKLVTGPQAMLTPDAAYRASKQQFYDLIAAIDRGDKDAIEQFQEVSDAFLELSAERNASGVGYFADLEAVKNATNKAAISSYAHVDVAKLQLSYLEQQVQGLIDINDSVQSLGSLLSNQFSASNIANGGASGTGMTAREEAGIADNVRRNLANAGGFDALYEKTKAGDVNATKVLQEQMVRWAQFGLDAKKMDELVGKDSLKKILELFNLRIEDFRASTLTTWNGKEQKIAFGRDGLFYQNQYAIAADRLKELQAAYVPPVAYTQPTKAAPKTVVDERPPSIAADESVTLLRELNENMSLLINTNSGGVRDTVKSVNRLSGKFDYIETNTILARAMVK